MLSFHASGRFRERYYYKILETGRTLFLHSCILQVQCVTQSWVNFHGSTPAVIYWGESAQQHLPPGTHTLLILGTLAWISCWTAWYTLLAPFANSLSFWDCWSCNMVQELSGSRVPLSPRFKSHYQIPTFLIYMFVVFCRWQKKNYLVNVTMSWRQQIRKDSVICYPTWMIFMFQWSWIIFQVKEF